MAILDNAVFINGATGFAEDGTTVVTEGANSTTVTGGFSANGWDTTSGGTGVSDFGAAFITSPINATWRFSNPVEDLSFTLQHVSSSGTTYDDEFTVAIYDETGTLIPAADIIASLTGVVGVTVYEDVNGFVVVEADNSTPDNVTFNLTGYTVGEVDIVFDVGPDGTQTGGAGISDFTFTVPPEPDFIVEGTAGADLINVAYADDPEGDRVDSLDHSDSSNNDSILAGAGNDTVYAGDGSDTVLGGDGNDLIYGGANPATSSGGTDTASLTYSVFHLGVAPEADVVDGDSTMDDPNAFLGTYGGPGDELYNYLQTAVATDPDGNSRINNPDTEAAETVTIDGTVHTIDAAVFYNATATFDDGTTTNFTALVVQTTDGNVYWFPETTNNAEHAALTSKPIESVTFNTVNTPYNNVTAIRMDGDYALPGDTDTSGDSIDGGAGDDSIYGGAGDDTIYGGTGTNYLDGGDGNDVFVSDGTLDTIIGGSGWDIIDQRLSTETYNVDSFFGIEEIYASNVGDIWNWDSGPIVFHGGTGDDTVNAGTGADSIDGGAGADIISGGAGNDTINLGDGADTFVDGAGDDSITGGEGMDTFQYTTLTGADTVVGGELNDTAPTNSGDKLNFHDGTEGVDVTFTGNESGVVTGATGSVAFTEIEHFLGGQGSDTIDASASTVQQILDGGEGADTIQGGSGDDIIAMGLTQDFSATDGDNDTLVLVDGFGADSIEGFEIPTDLGGGVYSGNDQVDVTGLTDAGGNPVNVNDVTVSDTNGDGTGDAILTFPNGESITLWGVTPAQVSSDAQLEAIGIPAAGGNATIYDAIQLSGGTPVAGDTLTTIGGDLVEVDEPLVFTLADTDAIAAGDTVTIDGTVYTVTGVNAMESVFTYNDGTTTTATKAFQIVLSDGVGGQLDYIIPTDDMFNRGEITEIEVTQNDPTTDAEVAALDTNNTVTLGSPLDQIVEGDGTANLIDAAYTGDPEGDMIDAGDNLQGNDNDSVEAGAGDDTILSGAGADTIHAGADNDSVDGGAGDDVIHGDAGDDTLLGGSGNDTIGSGAGENLLTNGSFEQGTHSANSVNGLVGWSNAGGSPDSPDDGTSAESWNPANAGSDGTGYITMWAQSTGPNEGIQQTLDTPLAAGETYTLTFDAISADGSSPWFNPTDIPVLFEIVDTSTGTVLGSTTVQGTTYETYTFDFTPAAAVSTITLRPNTTGVGTYPSVIIDQVSLTQAVVDEAGDDSIDGGLGDDVIVAGSGDDTIALSDGFGNDIITGGETGETNGDTLDLSATTTGVTVDLTNANPETGTVSNGVDTASFTEIENITLGGGRDTVVLADGSGADTVQAFDMTDSGDGTTNDQLDVSGLTSDGGTTPVTTADVVVTDTNGDGTGDAILTFPGGESITLVGVSPTQVDSPAELAAIGIPQTLNYIVEGTSGDDLIDMAYVGDPQGDMVDANDNLAGDNVDVIEAGEGNDTVYAGLGSDTVIGENGDDSIFGEAGDDTLYGDGGADTIEGGIGNDFIVGGSGADSLYGQDGADRFNDGTGDDYVEGGADADTFFTQDGYGVDTIVGGETGTDNDTLTSYKTGDSVLDLTAGGTAADPESGTLTAGVDVVNFTEIEQVNLGSGNDTVIGSDGADTFRTGDGADVVDAGTGDDFYGLGVADGAVDTVVFADGDGNDTVGSFEAPTDLGGGTYSGNDQLDVSGLTDASGNPVNVDDVTVTDTNGDGTGDAILTFPNGESLTLTGVTVSEVSSDAQLVAMGIPGTSADYIVEGTAGAEVINTAYTGDPEGDMIDNSDAADGSNDDVVWAGDGDDSIDAGVGNDSILGQGGDDEIFLDGALQNDTIVGGETGETIGDRINFSTISDDITITFSGDEAGTITDGVSTTTFSEIERFQMGTGSDTVIGSAGAEEIIGNFGDDSIIGGGGDDTIYSGFDNDYVEGGAGNDSILASSGADTVEGGAGDDNIDVGPGDGEVDLVILQDGFGNDVLSSFETPTDLGGGVYSGNDQFDVTGLTDASGNPVSTEDVIVTDTNGDGTGDAILTFPNGESIIMVGVPVSEVQSPAQLEAMGIPAFAGDFIVEGTAGDDLIDLAYTGDPEGDMVDNGDGPGGTQDDVIFGFDGNDLVFAGVGDDDVDGGAGDDTLHGEGGNDSLDGAGGNDVLYGGAGDDTLEGGDGADTLNGGTGADLLAGRADGDTFVLEDGFGADTLEGGEAVTTGTDSDVIEAGAVTGDVTVTFTGDEAGTLTDGVDTATFSEIETIILGAGDDSVDASASTVGTEVWLGDGTDTAIGSSGDDTILGFGGDDSITGGAGNDALDGDDGNDTLIGGDGDDTLVGDLGDDSLVGGAGADELYGNEGNDIFDLGSGDSGFGVDGDDTFNVNAADMNGGALTVVGGELDETLGDTLNITGPAVINMTGAEAGTVTWLDGSVLTFSEIENINYIPCFTPGTLIKTLRGEVAVQDLEKGDLVLTRDNGYQPIRWVGKRVLSGAEMTANPALNPIRVSRGALGNGLPERDMLVSPQHRMMISNERTQLWFGEEEVLAAATHLTIFQGIDQELAAEGITYIHFMFDQHEIVVSDGAWSESFQPGDLTLGSLCKAQRDEIFAIFPELETADGQAGYSAARVSVKADDAKMLLKSG